jgi:hypothetical protein
MLLIRIQNIACEGDPAGVRLAQIMCQIILLVFGIIYAFRIPKILKAQPGPLDNPEIFWSWRAKELMSIYVFLAATWGSMIIVIVIGIIMAIGIVAKGGKADELMNPLMAINAVLFVGPLIWAVVLSSQATKLKKQLASGGLVTGQHASYYPRPGQPVLQAPPEGPIAPPPAAPEPEDQPQTFNPSSD